MIYEGAFNPRSARITIVKTIAGVPKDIKISAVKCPICIKEGKNRCVELCPFDALKAVGI
ncbi:MAG: hypothetical protein HY929_05260 [Euryarchaeota archaeon]|nr:hypothetical protein [Euryarchaeota archaeon]